MGLAVTTMPSSTLCVQAGGGGSSSVSGGIEMQQLQPLHHISGF